MITLNKILFFPLFVLVVVALIVFKWHDLHLPYFWDELGVYSQAADYQYHHALSLMPASVPPVLSRGHPLLFTFEIACVMRIFGESIFAVHAFCLLISLLLLTAIYLKVSRYINTPSAFLCVAILAMQPIFLAQCGLALPEISLALLIFMALCSYYENKFLLFSLYASLAILTKESAIVLPIAVFIYSILLLIIDKTKKQALSPLALLSIGLPYLVFAAFLLIQKKQNGWYFFPYHIESVSINLHAFMEQFKQYAIFLFRRQGRYLLTSITLAGLIVSWVLHKKRSRNFLLLIGILALLFLSMNSLFSVYLDRYIMTVVVIFCVMAGILMAALSHRRRFMYPVLLVLLLLSVHYWEDGWFHYDADLGYRRGVHVVQQSVAYTIGLMKPGDKVFANFPAYYAFSFPAGGYMPDRQIDKKNLDNHGDFYLLLCDPGAEYDYDHQKYKQTFIRKFDDGPQHVTLYRMAKAGQSQLLTLHY